MFDLLPTPPAPLPPATAPSATRLLAISGGGLLGVIAAAFLERLEILGRGAYGRNYRLCHSFDLVGGTSTGAVLATAVALGLPAERMIAFYIEDTRDGFRRNRLSLPGIGPLFDAAALRRRFAQVTRGRCLTRSALATHLAVVVKDFEDARPTMLTTAQGGAEPARCLGAAICHAPVALDDVLRASTAAPGIFAPERLPIGPDGEARLCVDGGLSPFNDPALLLHHYVRAGGMGARGAAGPLDVTALGAGDPLRRNRVQRLLDRSAGQLAFAALRAMIADGMRLADTELRRLAADPSAELAYRRHDITLTEETFALLGISVDRATLSRLRDPFDTRGKARLYEIAALYAEQVILAPPPPPAAGIGESLDAVA